MAITASSPTAHHSSARRWSRRVLVKTLCSIAVALLALVVGEEDLLQVGFVRQQADDWELGGRLDQRVGASLDHAPQQLALHGHVAHAGQALEGRGGHGGAKADLDPAHETLSEHLDVLD